MSTQLQNRHYRVSETRYVNEQFGILHYLWQRGHLKVLKETTFELSFALYCNYQGIEGV